MRRDDGVLLSRRRCRGIRSRRVELIQRLSELGEKTLLVGLYRIEGERLRWSVRGGRRLLMVVRVSRKMVRRRGRKGVELEGVEGSLLLLLLRREAEFESRAGGLRSMLVVVLVVRVRVRRREGGGFGREVEERHAGGGRWTEVEGER